MSLTPRFVELDPLLMTGMREPLNEQSTQTIPVLWQKFAPFHCCRLKILLGK